MGNWSKGPLIWFLLRFTIVLNYILSQQRWQNSKLLANYKTRLKYFAGRPTTLTWLPGGGVLLRILGGSVPPGSPNPDPLDKVYTRFNTKKGPKTTPFGAAHTIWLKKGVPSILSSPPPHPPPLPHITFRSHQEPICSCSHSLQCSKALRTMILMFSHHLGGQFNTRRVKK